MKNKTSYAIRTALATAMAIYSTGCAGYNIKPNINASTDEAGNLERKVGVEISAADKDSGDGFWTVLTAPFRPSQWSDHTGRTALVTAGYIGAIVGVSMAFGGHGGGGSSTPADTSTQPNYTGGSTGGNTTPTQPSNPKPGNSGDGGTF